MQIRIVCIGKLKERFYREACAEYQKRLSRYHRVEVVELGDEAPKDDSPAAIRKVLQREGEKLLPYMERCRCVALDIRGETPDSLAFAQRMRRYEDLSMPVSFFIGGSWGLDESVLSRCQERLSLSCLTLPHNLARLVLLEQLYRSARINSGAPYHK